ncbi:MAG: hypothetical protein ACE5HS_08515 [bacterium]
MKFCWKIKSVKVISRVKKVVYFLTIVLLAIFVYFGAWCLPPKMVTRILQALKSKSQTEQVLKNENELD